MVSFWFLSYLGIIEQLCYQYAKCVRDDLRDNDKSHH